MKTIKLKLHKEVKLPKKLIDSIPDSGAADNAIAEARQVYKVLCSLKDSQEYLKSYGTWDIDELSNLDENIDRILWLACLYCQENNTQYFYMGT